MRGKKERSAGRRKKKRREAGKAEYCRLGSHWALVLSNHNYYVSSNKGPPSRISLSSQGSSDPRG